MLTYRQYDSSVLVSLIRQMTKIYIKYTKLYLANKANKQRNTVQCVCVIAQGRQYMYNVTLMCVRATIVTVE